MRKLKPQDYLNEFFPDSGLTPKTVINWIKRQKIKGEQTPTGRWLVIVEEPNAQVKNVNNLVNMLMRA